MSFQVLVKTTPHMHGSYAYTLVNREAAEVFVQRSDVWWYFFPLDEDILSGSSWRKGGAWSPQPDMVADRIALDDYGLSSTVPDVPKVPTVPTVESGSDGGDEEDDDRWG